jgi:hypothetical protein
MKDIEKAHESIVFVVALPIACEFGEVQRQRAIGAQQAEEVHVQAWRPTTAAALEALEGGRCERHGWILAKPNGFVARAGSLTKAWLLMRGTLQAPQRLKIPVAVRRLLERLPQL